MCVCVLPPTSSDVLDVRLLSLDLSILFLGGPQIERDRPGTSV